MTVHGSVAHLIVGRFYWIYASINGRPRWRPARFTGVSGDADALPTFDYIGLRSEDGHHFAKVKDIGTEVKL